MIIPETGKPTKGKRQAKQIPVQPRDKKATETPKVLLVTAARQTKSHKVKFAHQYTSATVRRQSQARAPE